eukprot:gb/GECG01003831.1/.p1 GENE.gb/GECG01003831.1/~~gb/GECG01003831.1/.p1  ORF type:complete len:100 (+),score=11.99 gb/GECG01003831.1/:1-300(+)
MALASSKTERVLRTESQRQWCSISQLITVRLGLTMILRACFAVKEALLVRKGVGMECGDGAKLGEEVGKLEDEAELDSDPVVVVDRVDMGKGVGDGGAN